jgi:G3E family GTPase
MIKLSYIKKINQNTWRVFSEKGKNMGTYHSLAAAQERLKDIEFFKHKDERMKKYQKESKANHHHHNHHHDHNEDLTYSSYLRNVNKKNPENVEEVMGKFKKIFDKALLENTPIDEIESICLLEMQAKDEHESQNV